MGSLHACAARRAAARADGAVVPLPLDPAELHPPRPRRARTTTSRTSSPAFASCEPAVVAFELLRPLYDHGGEHGRAGAFSATRRSARSRSGGRAPSERAHAQAAALLFDDPPALLDRFVRMLEAYWYEAFAGEWRRLEPKLADGIASAGRKIARDGVYAFLVQLAPTLRVDPDAQTFGLDVPHDHRLTLGADNPLLLIPSAYVWPHVRVNCDAPWPLAVVYRAPHVVESLRPSSDSELERSLRALAAPTRIRDREADRRAPAEHPGDRLARLASARPRPPSTSACSPRPASCARAARGTTSCTRSRPTSSPRSPGSCAHSAARRGDAYLARGFRATGIRASGLRSDACPPGHARRLRRGQEADDPLRDLLALLLLQEVTRAVHDLGRAGARDS